MNLFESAEYAESLSQCKKRKVGASLSVNGEVVSIGFNHSDENCTCSMNHENPNVKHAEVSCLEHYEFLGNEYSEMAVTYMCCIRCAEYMTKKGVKRVYIRDWRDDKTQGVEFLKLNKVEVLKWK
jgi:deoxycytidylate deaminase